MRVVVTGGAGFIGSNLVDSLLCRGHHVTVVDDLSTGHMAFLKSAKDHPDFDLRRADLLDEKTMTNSIAGADAVVHFAANADVRFGWDHPRRDLEQNAIVTQNVLEAMRLSGTRRLLFSSTGSIYGEPAIVPTPEEAPFPIQTSLYGASKLAAEGLISAYAEAGFIDASVFRFVSILGPRYTHGHIFDFVQKLLQDPTKLEILGDGQQQKSYLHVHDCVEAILLKLDDSPKIEFLNLGQAYCIRVLDSARIVCKVLGVDPTFSFSGGVRGWVGDSPLILLDASAMNRFGWSPKRSIEKSIRETAEWLIENQWVYNRDRSSLELQ